MLWTPKIEGRIVYHKLLGRTLIVHAPEASIYWDIRLKDGTTIMVKPEELVGTAEEFAHPEELDSAVAERVK